jgi:hypothetical protein
MKAVHPEVLEKRTKAYIIFITGQLDFSRSTFVYCQCGCPSRGTKRLLLTLNRNGWDLMDVFGQEKRELEAA